MPTASLTVVPRRHSGGMLTALFDVKCSFPGGSEGTVSACSVGDLCSVPGLGRPPGEGNGTPLQYPCLKNPMDRGAS